VSEEPEQSLRNSIRESNENDQQAIRRLHLEAFGEPEGASVSQLAIDLLADETARPVLSLVAEKGAAVVGHVIFSSVRVAGNACAVVYIMAPLAVAADLQKTGIGTALIQRGLELLGERAAQVVLVLGDPNYYSRAGFHAGHDLEPPYDLEYPEAWMALELQPGALAGIHGVVRCADSLHSPELW